MRDAGDVIELRHAVIQNRIVFGALVTATFSGQYMQKLRALPIFHFVQRIDEQIDVVTINGPDVIEAQLFPHRARQNHAFRVRFPTTRKA